MAKKQKKSDVKKSQLAKNIKALREMFGETQPGLGQKLGFEQPTISNYERDERTPDLKSLKIIADYFGVTVSQLINSDLSCNYKVSIDYLAFFRNIDIVFPTVCSDNALQNPLFNNSYQSHMRILSKLKSISIETLNDTIQYDIVYDILDKYFDAFYKFGIIDAAVNFISVLYLVLYLEKNETAIASNQNFAILNHVINQQPSLSSSIKRIRAEYDSNEYKLSSFIYDKEAIKELNEMKTAAKKTHPDLIEYYLAVPYLFGFVNNDLEQSFNEQIGAEMLESLSCVENTFASNYLEYNFKRLFSKHDK